MIEPIFWQGRTVFLTGHTGFKGSWLSLWLSHLGADVSGYSLGVPTTPALYNEAAVEPVLQNLFVADIRDGSGLSAAMQQCKPSIVIHMAAQPLVRDSYLDPVATYSTNVMGTVNMLEAVRATPSVKAVLNITTDKCYENNEWLWGYRENEPMGGHDPYSSSKGCAELVSAAYRRSFLTQAGVALATARCGNVVGGGDWAADRIVPDAMRAFIQNRPVMVRNPRATRPWQHVLEPLAGYIVLCQQLIQAPEAFACGWNFGPSDDDAQPVSKLADIMAASWGVGACWEHDGSVHPHEANYLKLDCSKAKALLQWNTLWDIEQALDMTVQWYKAWNNRQDMHQYTLDQIKSYQQKYLAG